MTDVLELSAVDWPAVAGELVDTAPESLVAAAIAEARRHRRFDHVVVATIVNAIAAPAVERAIRRAGAPRLATVPIAAWLAKVSKLYVRGSVMLTASHRARDPRAGDVDVPEGGARLEVLDGLVDELPLLELAGDVARLQPNRCLVVLRGDDLAGADGLYERGRPSTITLARNLEGWELAEVWAHELGHALDMRMRGDIGDEVFTNRLTGVFLGQQPTTVVACAEWIASADTMRDEVPRADTHELLEDALLFESLDLTPRSAAAPALSSLGVERRLRPGVEPERQTGELSLGKASRRGGEHVTEAVA